MDNGCMAEISPEKRLAVWQHWYGDATDGFDACGAYIERDAKADTDNAWEVDHIFPAEILEIMKVPDEMINDPANLRPLHHSNNESKGISYPRYLAKRVQPGTDTRQAVPLEKQQELARLYHAWIAQFHHYAKIRKFIGLKLSQSERQALYSLILARLW